MEEEKVWHAPYHLLDVAQQWYMWIERDQGTPSWHRFIELINLYFGPPIRANPIDELVACCRTGTMADYQERFLTLLT